MMEVSNKLINAIKKAAKKLRSNSPYSWGHLGSCNCGHLVQSLTKLSKDEIHEAALEKTGDWSEISKNYCDTSGLKIDKIISIMLNEGLALEDIEYLENLSDPDVIKKMEVDIKSLRKNNRLFVINYLEVWSKVLEEKNIIAAQKFSAKPQNNNLRRTRRVQEAKELKAAVITSSTHSSI